MGFGWRLCTSRYFGERGETIDVSNRGQQPAARLEKGKSNVDGSLRLLLPPSLFLALYAPFPLLRRRLTASPVLSHLEVVSSKSGNLHCLSPPPLCRSTANAFGELFHHHLPLCVRSRYRTTREHASSEVTALYETLGQ